MSRRVFDAVVGRAPSSRIAEAVPAALLLHCNIATDIRMHRADADRLDDAQVWDETAADYDAFAEPFTRQYARAALDLAGGVVPGERVLDVAAGTGALAVLAARAGGRVVAIDFSPGMVARLESKLNAEGLDRIGSEARAMDGQALDLPDATFDAAFSIFGVMLFPDHRRGLAEMARVLRPGARAAVAVWTKPEGAGPGPLLVEASRNLFPDRPVPSFPAGMVRLTDAGALASDMAGAGFRDVRITAVSGVWTAPSADWVADNADRLFRQSAFYAAMPEADRLRVRAALHDRLRGMAGTGEVRLASEAHVAVARR